MREWYFVRDGAQMGPVTVEELSQMIADGEVTATDLVWKEGMSRWQQAVTQRELFPHPVPPAYAPPPPAAGSVRPLEYQSYRPQPLNYYASVHYAGFWIRFGAWIIDQLIIGAANFTLGLVVGGGVVASGARVDEGTKALLQLVSVLIAWLYYALQESSGVQATVGKRAVGIKVTDLFGRQISFGRATGRHFGKLVSTLTLLVGYIMAGCTQRKQALHDMMAGCLVVRG